MLVAFLDDYRTLYIRLADRLHTLRLLGTLPLDAVDKKKITQEALSVYAPLAHKMGVMKVKGELEDLAFRFLSPETFRQSKYAQVAANKAYHQAADQIQELINNDSYLKEQKAQYRLTYRIKDKYQLNLKMQRKELKSINEVRDALGLRIIVDAAARKLESPEDHARRSEEICYYFVSKLQALAGWEPTGRCTRSSSCFFINIYIHTDTPHHIYLRRERIQGLHQRQKGERVPKSASVHSVSAFYHLIANLPRPSLPPSLPLTASLLLSNKSLSAETRHWALTSKCRSGPKACTCRPNWARRPTGFIRTTFTGTS